MTNPPQPAPDRMAPGAAPVDRTRRQRAEGVGEAVIDLDAVAVVAADDEPTIGSENYIG